MLLATSSLVAACASSTTETAGAGRFFDGVPDLSFSETLPDSRVEPRVRVNDQVGLRLIREPNESYPLVEYTRPCGGQDPFGNDKVAYVYTFAPSQPDERFSSQPDEWRTFGFNPGSIAEKTVNINSNFLPEGPEKQYAYTDHVRGVDPNDPLVGSYQWTHVPGYERPQGATSFSTGAWVITSFQAADGTDIEVLVFAGAGYDVIWHWESGAEQAPALEELIDTPNDPTIGWRFDCVAETWESIEPTVRALQQGNQ